MKITIIIVIYKITSENSSTFLSLLNVIDKKDTDGLSIIVYDNSPENQKQQFQSLQFERFPISYYHDPRNLGIATAYNYAWSIAKENGSQWLLLLDHDTNLTDAYINEVLNLPNLAGDVAAFVPKIRSENTMISPVYSHSLRPLKEKRPKKGLQEQPVMAINSGALIQIDFLNEIGGFNEKFPLDYLDHWLFFEIYAKGKKVWLLDVILEHELSVMDYRRVSLKRYQSILNSEMTFYKNYKKDLFPSYRKQLAKRFLKQVLTVKNKKIAMQTLRQLISM
jgi:GT2 family glycosyltransferase